MAGKFIVLSDIHLNLWSCGDPDSRLDDQMNAIGTVLQRAVEDNVDAVLWPGDIFHTQGEVHTAILCRLYTVLNSYRQLADRMVFLPGNHDMVYRNESTWHALDFLSLFGKVPRLFHGTYAPIDLPNMPPIWPLPYADQEHKINVWLDGFENRSGDLLLMHQGVKGVEFHSKGFVLDEGLTPGEVPDGIFHAFVGHCHSLCRVAPKVTVPGALQQHHFGDAGDPRGYLLVDYDDTGVVSMRQMTVGGTFFHDVTYDPDLQALKNKCEALNAWENEFVRITDVPPSKVDEVRVWTRDTTAHLLRIVTRKEVIAPVMAPHNEMGNIEVLFDRFTQQNSLADDLLEVGRSILRQSSGAA